MYAESRGRPAAYRTAGVTERRPDELYAVKNIVLFGFVCQNQVPPASNGENSTTSSGIGVVGPNIRTERIITRNFCHCIASFVGQEILQHFARLRSRAFLQALQCFFLAGRWAPQAGQLRRDDPE